MSKIRNAFHNGKVFIPFITCGDPELPVTEQIIYALERAGAGLIELGIPFSDPTAEGPVFMDATIRALKNHITTDDIFDMIERIRGNVTMPLVLSGYANVVFSYGMEKFLQRCSKAGIDGMILQDIPYEEKEEFACVCEQYGVEFLSMIAPTSKERIHMITKDAQGFVSCISSLNEKNDKEQVMEDVRNMTALVKETQDIPCAVGFRIATPQQVRDMASCADGVIVGSAIVRLCEQYGKDCVPHIEKYVSEMVEAMRQVQ